MHRTLFDMTATAQQQYGDEAALLVTEAYIAGRLTERDMACARLIRARGSASQRMRQQIAQRRAAIVHDGLLHEDEEARHG
jgi:cell division septum initiation protein DivIVA